eukprot:2624008-Amphidinium_carterae.1
MIESFGRITVGFSCQLELAWRGGGPLSHCPVFFSVLVFEAMLSIDIRDSVTGPHNDWRHAAGYKPL